MKCFLFFHYNYSEKFSKLPGWCPREVPASVKLDTVSNYNCLSTEILCSKSGLIKPQQL